MRRCLLTLCLGMLLSLPCMREAQAMAFVEIQPGSQTIGIGQIVDVRITALFTLPVLGWGLDLTPDGAVIEIVGTPQIGPLWIPSQSLDGDDLAGVAFPAGISGDAILLATFQIRGIAPGVSVLRLGTTPMDLTEGFALDAAGFDGFSLSSATITVPEPPLVLFVLLAIGAVTQLRSTRQRGGGR